MTDEVMNFNWNETAVDYLKQLHADKCSASEIAAKINEKFHAHVSRNSIIGKVDRLGIGPLGGAERAGKRNGLITSLADDRESLLPPPDKKIKLKPPEPEIEEIQPTPDEDLSIPMEQRKNFMELGPHSCRWIVGDPREETSFYCGSETADITERRPYCKVHTKRSYVPTRPLTNWNFR